MLAVESTPASIIGVTVVEEATDEDDKDLNIKESQRTVSQKAEYVELCRGQTNQDHSDRLKRQTSSYKDQDFVYYTKANYTKKFIAGDRLL